MSDVEKSRLDELAQEINQEHQAFRSAFKTTFRSAMRAGDLLNEAKAQAGHGNWTAWVEENCEFSGRTAQVYMRLANNRGRVEEMLAKSAEPADLSIEAVLRELSSPEFMPIEIVQVPRETTEAKGRGMNRKFMRHLKQAARAHPTERPRVIEEIVEKLRRSQEDRKATVDQFSPEEQALFDTFCEGTGIVLNMRDPGPHANLVAWLEDRKQLVKADRTTKWGNPFEIPDDGGRETVVRLHKEHYLPYKRKLLDQLSRMGGTAWGCWCAPQPCHCDELLRIAEGEGSSRAQ